MPHSSQSRNKKILRWMFALLAVWAVTAYLLVPLITQTYFQHHAVSKSSPRITTTADKHPGDPLNLSIVGSEEEIIRAMTAAGWFPADPITFDTSVRIAVDSVFRKPDENAPVSNLFLFGRKQDLALEKPIGNSPRQRHHVRFWRCDALENGRATWLASATLDERVGLSYANAQITHHIGPDVDAERDLIMGELKAAGWVSDLQYIDGFHQPPEGRNGGGDLWKTDGRLGVIVLQSPTH
ncbi:MAG: LssY C-terminal domain-containing protein [Gloeobacteraceae cyanobacterium ES-bin-144]|nr:LssY C-terminal domain-containing protein [Verrucomicrobiales bacterium]